MNTYRNWTVTVTQKIEDNKNKGAWIIDVEAVNGAQVKIRNFHGIISKAMLEKAVTNWIDTIESAKEVDTNLDFTEPVPETPVEPTAAELERQEWEADRNELRQVMELVRDGVFSGTEKQITDLQAKVKTGFKANYLR